MKRIFVAGGMGFIGSNFVRHLLKSHQDCHVVNYDKLTYAGNIDNLRDVEKNKNYKFVRGDICNAEKVHDAMRGADIVVNFAAESHVDRSIANPVDFIKTDVFGTYTLLQEARKHEIEKFVQIGTDEVYGSVEKGHSTEKDMLHPRNPYSASKAGADMVANSFFTTYGLPVVITRSSNNFGPYQYPEKIIPLFITNLLRGKHVPLYGDGKNKRDWLFVQDNCEAIDAVMRKGGNGEIYNIGGGNEVANIDLTKMILAELGKGESMIDFVDDRLGHDRRYALDCSKVHSLGWKPRHDFRCALKETIAWYVENRGWWEKLLQKNGAMS